MFMNVFDNDTISGISMHNAHICICTVHAEANYCQHLVMVQICRILSFIYIILRSYKWLHKKCTKKSIQNKNKMINREIMVDSNLSKRIFTLS